MIIDLPLSSIIAGDNDRTVFAAKDIESLAASLAADGLLQPITVRPSGDKFEIVAGERRSRAARLLGWEHISCIVRDLDAETASRMMLLENLARVNLDPVDEAHAYDQRIKQFGYTVESLSKLAGVTPKRIQSRLSLLGLKDEILDLVRSGQLALGFAEAMFGLDRNFQSSAIAWLNTCEKPTIKSFRAICSGLLERQNQCAMAFDFSSGEAELILENLYAPASIPLAEHLPALKTGRGTIGKYILQYASDLESEGFELEAVAVKHLLRQMIDKGWTTT